MKTNFRVGIATLAILSSFSSWPASANPEPWYFWFELGSGVISPGGQYKTQIDTQAGTSTPMAGSLGVLWALDDSMALGPIVNVGILKKYRGSSSFGYTQELISASLIKSFSKEPGLGFNILLEPGIGIIGTNDTAQESTAGLSLSRAAFGIAAGAGYGFPLSNTTRLMFLLKYCGIFLEGSQNAYTATATIVW